MAFGFISLYEVLGQADSGRQRTIRIPLIDVSKLRDYIKRKLGSRYSNFYKLIWWMARGRPRYVNKIIMQYTSIIEKLRKNSDYLSDFIYELSLDYIDDVPIVDKTLFNRIAITGKIEDILAKVMFLNIVNYHIKDREQLELLELLNSKQYYLILVGDDRHKVPVDEIIDSLYKDIYRLAKNRNVHGEADMNKIKNI